MELEMDELIKLINRMPSVERDLFASSVGTSIGYIRKVASAGLNLGTALCVNIERETKGNVSRKMLRPNDWQKHWPELH